MLNLENPLDKGAEKIDRLKKERHGTIDMTYAYGQVPLYLPTAKQCNFQIIGGKST